MAEEMPKHDMKGKAAMIVAAMGKPAEGEDQGGDAESEDAEHAEAKNEAVSAMMSAMKTDNAQDFKAALEDFIAMCGY